MIKYELKCGGCAHQFEGWFADSATYDSQSGAGEILCPVCSSVDVGKAIMAPNIAVRKSHSEAPTTREMIQAEVRRTLMEMRREVEKTCDYVGNDFANEARRINAGEADKRGIYGDATIEEARDLQEDGIDVMPMPWVPPHDA
ncbi:MAG: DUF1178 family protein [Alphaproteobacteria bacterium]